MSALRWLAVPLLVIPLGWVLFTGLGRDPSEIASPLIGQPLPSFSASTMDGKTLATADLAGRPAIINFWASWCIPACVEEHPVLMDTAAAHPEVQLVGVLYQDTTTDALAFLARYGDGGWPHLVDPDGAIALDFGVTAPPETYFVDANGIVRAKHYGPLTAEAMAGYLELLGVAP